MALQTLRPVRSTLYRGGAVYSPADPFAEAMLVVGDTVAWIGSADAAAGYVDAADEVVELAGGLVAPAFVDGHAHLAETGLALTGLDLTGATSVDDVLSMVARAARGSSGVLLGHGWDEGTWPDGRTVTRAELDRAAPGRAVYLARVDVHSAVVSTVLAERHRLADLPGWHDDGRIERDAHHAARALTRDRLSPAHRRRLHEAALTAAAAAGIGCVHEMSAPHIAPVDDLTRLHTLVQDARQDPDRSALPLVIAYRGALAGTDAEVRRLVDELALPAGAELRGLAGDLCIDGSLGSRTAAVRLPYRDADTSGHRYLDVDAVRDHVAACTRAGLQAGFHVIGDAALDVAVAGFRAAADLVGAPAVRAGRHRLEHLEMVDADAVATLADLAVTASVQPAFDAVWGGATGMYAQRLGAERAAAMNPFAALSRAGVALVLGSDSPVTPFDPWGAVAAAAQHRTPSSRISVRAGFLAATRGGWRAAGFDGQGVLAPGSRATFAVWSRTDLVVQTPDDRVRAWSTDPRSGTPGLPDLSAGVGRPRCLRTVIDGQIAFDIAA